MKRMSNINETKEFSPFVTPDSLRKTLQLLKNFYNGYTKKNCGYEDIDGSQYSGVVENFGSELLLEARKILMDKPSLKNVFVNNTFDFYFDIQYSDLINTYDQQYMLVALLEKDVLLSNKEYYIRFENCDERFVLRSESWSDPVVHRDRFIHTTTPPVLVISDINNPDLDNIEIPLLIDDGKSDDTNYYFFINKTTIDMVESYDEDSKILTTKKLTDKMYEQPFVWICVDIFRLFPDISFENNLDVNNNTLLTMGTDGHDVNRLYPLIYGNDNIPDTQVSGKWYIKVFPSDGESFISSSYSVNNYNVSIGDIYFINVDELGQQPHCEHKITFDHSYTKIMLSKDVKWSFKRPTNGDYDYDGTSYDNRCYGYISLDSFNQNIHETYDSRPDLISAFIVKFSDDYLHEYEGICENAVSGIHIDSSSEYSDNGVSKKNGVIHDLGEFEGLPKYFTYLLDRTIHRIHAELYSIRDDLNNRNQTAVDKQTAALIIDSAIPQNDIVAVLDNLNVVIKYDNTAKRTYITTGESISPRNSLSEITFVDENTFGNSNLSRQTYLNKFVYHGNRVFSLGMAGFDPELETSRVYYVNNDSIDYDNNEKSNYHKAARCLCRICDIPTSFVQLLKVENFSPTLVIDENYVRSEVPYMVSDKDNIWNNKSSRLVTKELSTNQTTMIFSNDTVLDEVLDETYLSENYSRTGNLNTYLNMKDSTGYEFTVLTGGHDYVVGDTFTTILGGIYIKGEVTDIEDVAGSVVGITMYPDDDAVINIGNISSQNMRCKTTTVTGVGDDLELTLSIDDITWASLQPKTLSLFNDLYTFKFDKFGNVWIWKYDTNNKTWVQYIQFTGNPVIENYYDDYETQQMRTLVDVFMRNTLIHNIVIKNMTPVSISSTSSDIERDIDLKTDLSSSIKNVNTQDTLYILTDLTDEGQYHDIVTYQMNKTSQFDEVHKMILPRFHQLNLSEYYNKSNTISYSYETQDGQPILQVYNPFKDTIEEFKTISTDILKCVDKNELTFIDTLGTYRGIDFVDKDSGILSRNVYSYNERELSTDIKKLNDELINLTHDELIEYISTNIDINAYPLQFEDTDYEFTDQMLIDYIMNNSYNSPIYKKNDISLLRRQGEKVVDYVNGKYVGIGEQPKGGYEIISSEIFDPQILVDKKSMTADILFVFNIEDDEITLESLNEYRILDDDDNDISEYSMLICNGNVLIFQNDHWITVVPDEE